MGAASRRKGKAGENHVARAFTDAGHTVMQLQRNRSDMADLLVNGRYYVDAKNHNRWQLGEWLPEIERITPDGSVPVLAVKKTGGKWWAVLPLDALVELPL